MGDGWSIILAKAVGAIAGAGLSITFMLPRSAREAAIRFFCGAFVGLVFGDMASAWLEQRLGVDVGLPAQRAIAGAFLAAFVAWYAMGFVTRLIRKAGGLGDIKGGD